MKIGNIEISEWRYNVLGNYYCRKSNQGMIYIDVIVTRDKHCFAEFYGEIVEKLNDFFEDKLFDSAEECKKEVDNYLIKLSKLTAFV